MKKRRIIQIVFFLIVLSISIGHQLEESGVHVPLLSTASLHAVCPFGGVVSVYEFFVSGNFVKKIHESSFILMFIVMGLALLMGPVFCGWICPFGAFQEWIGKIGKKIFKKKHNNFIPYSVDKYLRFIRYGVLIMILVKTAKSAQLMFSNLDPYYALFNLWTDEVSITSYVALLITVIASLFVERPFCKYYCPYGALLGLSNLFKIFKINRIESTCISCKKCDKSCPMNIPLSTITSPLKNHQCISCLECTSESNCPKDDTMFFGFRGKKLNSKNVAIITVGMFILGIGITMFFNIWNTETSKIPAKYNSGTFAGENDPGDIRGSYSFGDVEAAFNIPVADLVKAFGLVDIDNPQMFKIKEFEEMFLFEGDIEVGTDSVRLFVALYNGVPYTPETTTRLFRSVNSVLKDKITEEQKEYLNTLFVDKPNENTTVAHEEISSTELEIQGKTTFEDLISMGITMDQIIKVVGAKPGDLGMTVRDYAVEVDIEFSVLKEQFMEFTK